MILNTEISSKRKREKNKKSFSLIKIKIKFINKISLPADKRILLDFIFVWSSELNYRIFLGRIDMNSITNDPHDTMSIYEGIGLSVMLCELFELFLDAECLEVEAIIPI
jgi:hypothetical protein